MKIVYLVNCLEQSKKKESVKILLVVNYAPHATKGGRFLTQNLQLNPHQGAGIEGNSYGLRSP